MVLLHLTSLFVLLSTSAMGKSLLMESLAIPNIPPVEYYALYELYNNTNGDDWAWIVSPDASVGYPWNFSSPDANPCADEWQGIECIIVNNASHVDKIILSLTNLVGKLPASIGVFSNLTTLQLDQNFMSGSIPPAIGSLTSLQRLNLSDNLLHGTLPETFGNLVKLVNLSISDTYMHGTIPDTFQQLVLIENIALASNLLVGTLPDVVFNSMPRLTMLNLTSNQFNGTIPSVLLNGASIEDVNLGYNSLTGSIPPIFNEQSKLLHMRLRTNHLNGSIPHSIGNASQLRVLDLGGNQLTGQMPEELLSLSSLHYLYLTSNLLSGTIPPTLATACPLLSVVGLDSNTFTGPFPESMWALPNLTDLLLRENEFTGTISGAIGNASALYRLIASFNLFHSTIPASLGSCGALAFVDLERNRLSGTLPSSLGQLRKLLVFAVNDNLFTGGIPESYYTLPVLFDFAVNYNHLTGTISSTITGWQLLSTWNMYSNMISGTLPSALNQLPSLNTVILGGNKFRGTLDGMFNASVQTVFNVLSVENNQVSGTLPAELFRLPLQIITATGNCFSGTLPDTVCGCTTLSTVVLDGLSSAPACGDRLVSFSNAYAIDRAVTGTVPECIFMLPVLTLLHLSGNGLTGTLPNSLPLNHTLLPVTKTSTSSILATGDISPFLIDLSLSHNQLSGTIPLMFQRKKWFNLDLSYNRLAGSLSAEFASQNVSSDFLSQLSALIRIDITHNVYAESAVTLENNRISGRIPQILQDKLYVSILGTNMFSCNARATDLPQHDSGLDNYDCGSDSFNYPYYVWMGLAVGSILCVVFVLHRCHEVAVYAWHASLHSSAVRSLAPTLEKVLHLSECLARLAVCSTLFALLVLAPAYIVLSHFKGTVLHQYAWIVSAAFLNGVTPFIVMLVLLLSLLGGFVLCYKRNTSRDRIVAAPHVMSTLRTCIVYAAFILINLVFVIGANTAYVYVVIYHNSKVLLAAQFLLSCFKLLWNRFFSIYAIRYVAKYNPDVDSGDSSEHTKHANSHTTYTSLQVFVALLNNIAIPCFVVAIVSPNCFYNVFVASPTVDAKFTWVTCYATVNGTCTDSYVQLDSIPYNPQFTYNYQCSSSIITSYAPAFVILCIVRTFVTPLLQYTLYVQYCRSTPGTWWHSTLSAVTLPVVKPIQDAPETQTNECGTSTVVTSVYQPYFDANQLLLSLVTYLGILLTFGAVFPPLAVALLLTLYSVLYTTKAKLGRFLTSVVELNQLQYIDTVENECKSSGIDTIVRRSVWMLVTASCWFYTLFLFDTLGDSVGYDDAYWVLIVVPLMPACMFMCSCVVERVVTLKLWVETKRGERSVEERDTQDLEMRTTSSTVDTVNILHHRSNSVV